jgi:hypothetical protein
MMVFTGVAARAQAASVGAPDSAAAELVLARDFSPSRAAVGHRNRATDRLFGCALV